MTDEPGRRQVDEDGIQRFACLCEMTRDMLDRTTPAQRDRMQQTHLAAARGPANNLRLMCEMADMLHQLKRAAEG